MTGGPPPDPELPQSVFNSLRTMQYDGRNMAFMSGTTLYFLFGEQRTGGAAYYEARWFYGTQTEGASNPKGFIPQITFNVITQGTYNTDGTITYQGARYYIRLKYDTATSKQLAEAHVV